MLYPEQVPRASRNWAIDDASSVSGQIGARFPF
jgi:hypothetical protein